MRKACPNKSAQRAHSSNLIFVVDLLPLDRVIGVKLCVPARQAK